MPPARRGKHPARPEPPAAAALPPLPLAVWAPLAAVVGAALLGLVSFAIYDPDVWQHLLVGSVIWKLHAIPHVQWWSWPTWGVPDVLPSWLFRALLWPFWKAGGVAGLYAWSGLTTLLAFALLWRAARVAGGRGAFALFALFWCALFWRYRSQPRPETLVAVLLAAQLLVLETRRALGAVPWRRDPAWWLVPIALLWANTHISYYLGLALTGFHLLDALLPRRRAQAPGRARTLAAILAACVAASFVNPFGWRTLAQPFEYFFLWRQEPIYRIVGELKPVDWALYSKSFLPVWLVLLALLALWRWRRHGFDLAQALVLVVVVPQALQTQRLLGLAAVMVAPFFARDLDRWMAGARWPARLRAPWAQAGVVTALVAIAWAPTFGDELMRPGPGVHWEYFPVRSCDWMRDHRVRGRGFNPFELGGYLLFRFWPDRGKLPFMDIHQAGTLTDRSLAAYAYVRPAAWRQLDDERRFDWALLPTEQDPRAILLDTIDADTTTWALVSFDDASVLYLRRDGAMATLAARERYRLLPGAAARLGPALERCAADTLARRALRAELERAAASSPWNGRARDGLARLDTLAGRR
jgi:hypothetical protein